MEAEDSRQIRQRGQDDDNSLDVIAARDSVDRGEWGLCKTDASIGDAICSVVPQILTLAGPEAQGVGWSVADAPGKIAAGWWGNGSPTTGTVPPGTLMLYFHLGNMTMFGDLF